VSPQLTASNLTVTNVTGEVRNNPGKGVADTFVISPIIRERLRVLPLK
jgi:hypothetical protein